MPQGMVGRFVLIDDDIDQPIGGYDTLEEAKEHAKEMDNPAIFIRDVVTGKNFKPDDKGRFLSRIMRPPRRRKRRR